jgi:hypothetical protein
MKKTFTILAVATLLTSAAFAQYDGSRRNDNKYDNNNSHDVVVNNFPTRGSGYNDRGDRYFSEREKDMQIAQINQEYNYKIQSVRNQFFMGRYQKKRRIDALNFQRKQEIFSVVEKFNHQAYNKRGHGRDRNNW